MKKILIGGIFMALLIASCGISKQKNNLVSKEAIQIQKYLTAQEAFFKQNNTDSVLVLGEKIRKLAIPLGDSMAIAKTIYFVKGDVDFNEQKKLLPHIPGAINTFEQNKMQYEAGIIRSTYGVMLIQLGNFKEAQNYLFQAYKIFEQLDSLKPKFSVCLNIGSNFSMTNNVKEALKYYKEALTIAVKMKDSVRQVSALMNIGTEYVKENYNAAMQYYNQAEALLPKQNTAYLKMKLNYNIAEAYLSQNKYELAKPVFIDMLDICVQNNQVEGIAMAEKGLAEVYNGLGQTQQSIFHYEKAIKLLENLGMQFETLKLLQPLVSLYKKNGDYRTSLLLTEKLMKLNDSIFSNEKMVAVKELETKYQTEKKVLEIKELKKDNFVKRSSIIFLLIIAMVLFLLFRNRAKLVEEKGFAYEALMDKYKLEKKQRENHANEIAALERTISSNTIQKSTSNEEGLYKQILNYYIKEKPYLNSKFRVDDLAQKMNSNQKEIAQVLKQAADVNFSSFTNKFRIEAARKMFEDPAYRDIKMEVISEKSGFGTIQSFYNAFELYTGVKPAYYRSSI